MTASEEFVDCFRWVYGAYRNIARLLYAMDPLLADHGFDVYGSWASIWPRPTTSVLKPHEWLPDYVVRQYYRAPFKGREVVTVAGIPWLQHDDSFGEPLCIVSRMNVLSTPDDVYWLAVAQAWDPERRQLRSPTAIGPDETVFDAQEAGRFREVVTQDGLLTVAWPLLDIDTVEACERHLVAPLLACEWPDPAPAE